MDLKEIKTLIDLMKKNDLSVFKMEKEGFKITLKKGNDFQPQLVPIAPVMPSAAPLPATGHPPASTLSTTKETQPTHKEITSPMVGTFYTAASPESPSYVEIGQEITEETVVCLIEAMKVMNEIKSEVRGIITEILVENGKPVQFGQPLFKVK